MPHGQIKVGSVKAFGFIFVGQARKDKHIVLSLRLFQRFFEQFFVAAVAFGYIAVRIIVRYVEAVKVIGETDQPLGFMRGAAAALIAHVLCQTAYDGKALALFQRQCFGHILKQYRSFWRRLWRLFGGVCHSRGLAFVLFPVFRALIDIFEYALHHRVQIPFRQSSPFLTASAMSSSCTPLLVGISKSRPAFMPFILSFTAP